jgi:Arc/MetJ-type ribon-helix-helix transcriptional regulator
MKRKMITYGVPPIYLQYVDTLVVDGVFPTRSEAIRVMLRLFIMKEKHTMAMMHATIVAHQER